jgi:hypothetical protein
MEFSLLGLPVGKAGEPISRIKILEAIWSDTPDRHADTRVVDVQVARLRLRLEQGLKNPELILTARGHPTSRSGAVSSNARRALDRGTPLQAFTDRGPAAAPSRLTCLRPLTHGRGARAAPCASERLRCRRLSRPDRNGGDPAGYPSADRTAPDGAGPGILKECEAMAP